MVKILWHFQLLLKTYLVLSDRKCEEYFIIKMQGKEITMGHSYGSFPGGSDGKVSACNAGDLGLIPGSSACNAGDRGLIPGSKDALEKEMAIQSSTLAWKIPWTEDPDRLQSVGSQRGGLSDFTFTFTQMLTASLSIGKI